MRAYSGKTGSAIVKIVLGSDAILATHTTRSQGGQSYNRLTSHEGDIYLLKGKKGRLLANKITLMNRDQSQSDTYSE